MSEPDSPFPLPTMDSPGGLSIRANQPESVAVCSDSELVRLVPRSNGNFVLRQHLLGEMVVRLWLYRNQSNEFSLAIAQLADEIMANDLVRRFAHRFGCLRDEPRRLSELEVSDWKNDEAIGNELATAWRYACRRLGEYLNCDGIIPVVINGEGIAIPCKIDHRKHLGKFRDWNGKEISGWIGESASVWESLGFRLDVKLGCAFGDYANSLWNGNHLVHGASFGLPVLLGACYRTDRGSHPLEVVCTGRIADRMLYSVNGINSKLRLAEKMKANVFAFPETHESLNTESELKLLKFQNASPCQQVLKEILSIANPTAEVSRAVTILFNPQLKEFDEIVEEYRMSFFGRSTQTKSMLDWLLSSLGSNETACRYVYGEPGCGKTAFMADLIHQCHALHDLHPSIFFFGRRRDREPDVLERLAWQLAQHTDFDWDSVSKETSPKEQFLTVFVHAIPDGADRPIFIVDGLDESDRDNLEMLISIIPETSRCIWILSGQPHLKDALQRRVPGLILFPLGRLTENGMIEYVERVAPDMPQRLQQAIVKKSEGLALYTSVVLKIWNSDGESLTLDSLPSLDNYWDKLLERILEPRGNRQEVVWRKLLIPILAVFAASRSRTSVSEDLLIKLLEGMGQLCSIDHVRNALSALSAILKRGDQSDKDKEGQIYWQLRHGHFREFLINDLSIADDKESAVREFAAISEDWRNTNRSDGERAYAAAHLIAELRESESYNEIIDLAKSADFIEFQNTYAGTRMALKTMASGIELAYDMRRQADSIFLTVKRATWAREQYAEKPIDALRRFDEARALETVARLENQDDRTLWHLTLAAYHAAGRRPRDAARILDGHIREGALREKLLGGTSFCAAAMLCILVDVETERFQWGWFLSRLTDESKEFAARTLIRLGNSEAAWSMIGSIKCARTRDAARVAAVRHLVLDDPRLAEKQLGRFNAESQREWAAQEIISASSKCGDWNTVNRLLEELHQPRQRAKALGAVSAELKRQGHLQDGKRAFSEAIAIINSCDAPDMKALACAEFAMSQAEHGGFLAEAERGFERAFDLLAEAQRNPEFDGKRKFTKKRQAGAYAGIAGCLAAISTRFTSFRPMMVNAIIHALTALAGSGQAEARDLTRLRLLRLVGRWGHSDQTVPLLAQFEDAEYQRRGKALLSALKLRYNPHSRATSILLKNAKGHEDRLEIAGIAALELVVTNRVGAVALIGDTLFSPWGSSAWRWGQPQLLAETLFAQLRKGETSKNALQAPLSLIDKNLVEWKRAWCFVDLAARAFGHGCEAIGKQLLMHARAERNLPRTEEQVIMVYAAIEELEVKYGLRSLIEVETNGFFPKLWANRNIGISYTFGLLRRIIDPFARSGREAELEQICSFVEERVRRDAFKFAEADRCEWAGEFAAQLAISVVHMPSLEPWLDRFFGVCKAISEDPQNEMDFPDSALRSIAVNTARANFKEGLKLALKIGDGEQMSKSLRDIAIHTIWRGEHDRIWGLCKEMVNARSEHLADIAEMLAQSFNAVESRSWHCADVAECLAEKASSMDEAASGLMRLLLVACSDYPDAAYRACAALVRLFSPCEDNALAIRSAVDDLISGGWRLER